MMQDAILLCSEALSSVRAIIHIRLIGVGLSLLAAASITGCGGGSGAATEQNPLAATPGVSNYNGPPPATADVQAFKINLWDNVQSNSRCGSCHTVEGAQVPMFARNDDVNLAYAEANGVVTLPSPADSTMVTKTAGGHHCWLTSDSACADILTTWITNWAGDLVALGRCS